MPALGKINEDAFNMFLKRLLSSMETSMNDFSKIVFAEHHKQNRRAGERTLLMSDIE